MFKINKIAKNFLSVGFANIVSQLLGFLTVVYYARILGKADFGKISLAQSILVYFNMITIFGFQTYGTKLISKAKDKSNRCKLIGDIVSLRFIIAFLCFLASVFIGFFSYKGYDFKNIMILYGFTLFPLAFNMDWVFSGTQEMEHNAIYNLLKNVIPFVLLMLFLKNKGQVYLIPVFTLVAMCFSSIYHQYVLRVKKSIRYSVGFDYGIGKMYLKAALPFFISGLLSMINCNVDSIIIGYMRTDGELGLYSSAYKIVFFLTNVIATIFVPLFPVMIEYKNFKDKECLNNLLKYISKLVVMIAFPIAMGGIILSKDIILLLFGKEYVNAYIPLIILMLYVLLLFLRETYGYALNAWNMEKQYLKTVLISSMVNLILNLILIPVYGIIAAAFTTLISEVINFVFMQKYVFKVAKTSYLHNFIKIILPTILMSMGIVLMKFLNISIIVNIIASIAIYFISVILFKYMTLNEIKSFLKRKNGI
ncbi:flippase [Haloimpatiens sp. FM7315]|uniref:flippase n=1 Tax=Haloimpatiens sp. FM7315 TaxID=3298609 RepID=UPI00370CC952